MIQKYEEEEGDRVSARYEVLSMYMVLVSLVLDLHERHRRRDRGLHIGSGGPGGLTSMVGTDAGFASGKASGCNSPWY
jgi:hypothetical protein